jgi:hypothetical protein
LGAWNLVVFPKFQRVRPTHSTLFPLSQNTAGPNAHGLNCEWCCIALPINLGQVFSSGCWTGCGPKGAWLAASQTGPKSPRRSPKVAKCWQEPRRSPNVFEESAEPKMAPRRFPNVFEESLECARRDKIDHGHHGPRRFPKVGIPDALT